MKKYWKVLLIVILLGGTAYMWSTDMTRFSSTEVLDGYNEKEAEEQFEQVKEKFPEMPATQTSAGVNPPHGQPGHRCDIPVGSSLDAPVRSTTPAASGLMNTNTSTATLNPPHGQPGHRCDLAVGAPLPQ
ncbi:hypothetical protein [Robertkochia flava]|uniref:hypothetical protein n=1 Tax=Robertkochia flava TaxID=3447986 RepID=UPI001CC939FA|nr:hypothetical protein [Robertkochia marina]